MQIMHKDSLLRIIFFSSVDTRLRRGSIRISGVCLWAIRKDEPPKDIIVSLIPNSASAVYYIYDR
jgi:hypothetical protein